MKHFFEFTKPKVFWTCFCLETGLWPCWEHDGVWWLERWSQRHCGVLKNGLGFLQSFLSQITPLTMWLFLGLLAHCGYSQRPSHTCMGTFPWINQHCLKTELYIKISLKGWILRWKRGIGGMISLFFCWFLDCWLLSASVGRLWKRICWHSPLVPGTGRLNVSQAASCPGNIRTGAVRVPQLDESAALPQLWKFLIVVLSALFSCSQSEKTCRAGQDLPESLPWVSWQMDRRQGSCSQVEKRWLFSPLIFLGEGGQNRQRCHSWYLKSLLIFIVHVWMQ